jgi:serine O-acetyltransferase
MKIWKEDVITAMERDPAARSFWEVFFTYNGVKALRMHRRANRLYRHGHLFLARKVASRCVRLTGIDIHPAATIGRRCFIDHGVGVVIGETAVVGDDVLIYQGATLGGTGKDTGKRHPTVEDRVMISAGAKVLGPITIGHDSKIGAGSVVLKEVPPYSTVVGVPGRVVKTKDVRVSDLDQVHIPDPILEELRRLNDRIYALEKQAGIRSCRYTITADSQEVEATDNTDPKEDN